MGPVATLVLICALLLPIGGAEGRGLRDEPLLYDLTGSDLLGWSSPSGELRPSADGATLPVRGEQSAFLSPGPLGIDASRLDRIELEIRLEPPDGRATLFWTDNAASGFVPEWKAELRSGRIVLDLSENKYWQGGIDRILIAPQPGTRQATLVRLEIRGARGAGERIGDSWTRFWKTELRAAYSVNFIRGARIGSVSYALLLGLLFVVLPLAFAVRKGRGFAVEARRVVPRLLIAGSLLFLARSGIDLVRIMRIDSEYLGGETMHRKAAALNPPGFYRLLLEAKETVRYGAPVELRAERPFPWEKGAYYLYPSPVVERADFVVSYQTPAPADSEACELLFRAPGFGSVYRRESP